MINLTKIICFLDRYIHRIQGDPDGIAIKYLKDSMHVDAYTLDWINPSNPNQEQLIENSAAKAIIIGRKVTISDKLKDQAKVLIEVDNPKLAIARIGNEFFVDRIIPEIDPSAKIDTRSKMGDTVYIGPHACIGFCEIGNNVVIHAHVIIHDKVTIGNNVIIKPGAVLGGEGFGFERDENGSLIKFPQIGGLIIEDDVEVGANTCIDRGSLSDTIIGCGTKINNLCHIAHNVNIGKNVIITGQVNISGSTVIEDDVWISPNASLRGHQRIGAKATIGMGAVVTTDVPSGEVWIGNPAKKMNN